jgi:PAS domain S-box-containing protein
VPADPAPGALRILRRVRAWLARSLANRVTAAALSISLAVALGLGGASYLAFRGVLTRRIETDLGAQARLVAQELGASLNGVARDLQALSASSLVANGLVDSHGRDVYLTPLLREHGVPGAPGTQIVLCDFRGRPIASNLPELPASPPDGATDDRVSAAVVEADGATRLVLSFPIVFPPTGQREGTLVARVDLGALFAGVALRAPAAADATLEAGGVTLRRRGTQGRIAVVAERELQLDPPLDRLRMRVALAEDEAVLAPVRSLGVGTLVAALLAFLVVAAAARSAAHNVTRRLAGLSAAAREIAAGTRTNLPGGEGPGDEVDTVASAFNGTLEKLRAVQETLEQKVAERTADLVQRERELKHSREQLAVAIEGSQLVVFRYDLERNEISFGDVGPLLLGYARDEIGASFPAWAALLHPEDRERIRPEAVAHLKARTPQLDARIRMKASDGTWRWLHVRGRVVERTAAGRARWIAGTAADVTAIEDLHRRLFAATRLASVGTLAAGVAHEINNPLTYLTANLTIAAEQLAGGAPVEARREDLRELLEEARDGADRIAAIVRSMRALGGPERGGEAREVDVRTELLAALQMVRNQIVQRARLEVQVDEGLPRTRARTNELGRVFLNLLVNAAQAIPEGSPDDHRITVKASRRDDSIVVEVVDTGTGIAPELRDRIFEPFFTTKAVGVGTGLGLSIAASIVESAGGAVEVDSEVGRGATFRVVLPAAQHVDPAAGPDPRAAGVAPARRRVLVIDDEPLVGRALERQLQPHHDVEVVTAASQVLLRVEAGERWDAILCDLMMTGTDGIAFYEALQERHPELCRHVAFVTGGVFGERATRFVAGHDVPLVSKPVEVRDLLRAVERLATGVATTPAPAASAAAST